jgi:hypothetical protein
MRPHTAKVSPEGTKRLGRLSEALPVCTPLMGRMFARAFTVRTPRKAKPKIMADARLAGIVDSLEFSIATLLELIYR